MEKFDFEQLSSLIFSGNNVIGPLVFSENGSEDLHRETECLICDDKFNLMISLPLFLRHLFEVHRIVIEDVQKISFLHEYINYWREKFKTRPIEEIIPSLKVDGNSQNYYLISSLLREDRVLRHELALKYALKVQEFERTDEKFKKQCLFCKFEFEGKRKDYLEHLSENHNLQLGNPQNLVYIDDLIAEIELNLKIFKCLYCEKLFPNKCILKEHMRKKLHKRINPSNKTYDKFYIVNYLEIGKTWQDLEKESDNLPVKTSKQNEKEENSDEDYSDWNEESDKINCLFCDVKGESIKELSEHMCKAHNFNFEKLTESLDFYQKVKLVNFIRKRVHNLKCFICDQTFSDQFKLRDHLEREAHFKLPQISTFDQPE